MEFLSGPGSITPNSSEAPDEEHLAQTESAMAIFHSSIDRIRHFKRRVEELGRSGQDTVITLLDVDDPYGSVLADALMPGHDWQKYRDAEETPLGCGLAAKAGIAEFLQTAGFTVAAARLASAEDLKVVVLSSEVALVVDTDFDTDDAPRS